MKTRITMQVTDQEAADLLSIPTWKLAVSRLVKDLRSLNYRMDEADDVLKAMLVRVGELNALINGEKM